MKLYMQQQWRHGRRQEDRAHRQGRYRRARRRQAPGAGTGRQRQGRRAGGLRADADRARRGADRDRRPRCPRSSWRPAPRSSPRSSPYHRAHELHAAAVGRADRRLGGEERHQEGGHAGHRLSPPGIDAEKSFVDRFKADGGEIIEILRVPLRNPDFAPFLQQAADAKPDALFVFVPSSQGGVRHEAVRRARPRQVRHQADRHRRCHRRRSPQRHGRRRARRRHRPQLFGRPPGGCQQGLRRGLQEGQRRHAAELRRSCDL